MSELTSPRKHDYLLLPGIGYFAVIDDRKERNRSLAWLRYGFKGNELAKLAGREAENFVNERAPELNFHSHLLDSPVHGIEKPGDIELICARDCFEQIKAQPSSLHQNVLKELLTLLDNAGVPRSQIGVTGSLRLGLQGAESDIDLIIYGTRFFSQTRATIRQIQAGEPQYALSESQWCASWERRDTVLAFSEYLWHERRKYNKLILDGIKVDFTYAPEDIPAQAYPPPGKKLDLRTIRSTVVDDRLAFGAPARYAISHPDIVEIVAPNATFTGQAFRGEKIEAQGIVEVASDGSRRLFVGTRRETPDQYIRVIRN